MKNAFNRSLINKRRFWYGIFLANLAAISFVFWHGSSFLVTNPGNGNVFVALGRATGLLLQFAILVQLVLISRISPIESAFGFDRLNRVHRTLGFSLFLLLVAHPLFLAIGYGMMTDTPPVAQTVTFLSEWEDVFKAFLGTLIFLLVGATSIPPIRKRLRYEKWHFVHLLTYLAVILSFGHQTKTADVAFGPALYYWLALNAGVFGALIGYRALRPLFLAWKHKWRVAKIVKETSDTYSVYITGERLDEFDFRAGQYANISFRRKGLWHTHPFSFSAEKNGEFIRFTMKGLGDFTKRISEIKAGTRVVLDGPYGLFVAETATHEKVLFIAGGIGVTPLRAMIGTLAKEGKDSLLLYGARTSNDIAFRSEFDELHKKGLLTVHYITNEPTEGYESGRIDEEKLKRLVPDIVERDVFICGPTPMMDATVALLTRLGLNRDQIHFEKFSF